MKIKKKKILVVYKFKLILIMNIIQKIAYNNFLVINLSLYNIHLI